MKIPKTKNDPIQIPKPKNDPIQGPIPVPPGQIQVHQTLNMSEAACHRSRRVDAYMLYITLIYSLFHASSDI